MNIARAKIPSEGNSPQNCIYDVPAEQSAKGRAKFGWPTVSDVGAQRSEDAKPVEICCGAPNSRTDVSRQCAEVQSINIRLLRHDKTQAYHIVETCGGDIAV